MRLLLLALVLASCSPQFVPVEEVNTREDIAYYKVFKISKERLIHKAVFTVNYTEKMVSLHSRSEQWIYKIKEIVYDNELIILRLVSQDYGNEKFVFIKGGFVIYLPSVCENEVKFKIDEVETENHVKR